MTKSIGACTWTFGDPSSSSGRSLPLSDIARQLVGWGFDGVELAGDLSAYTAAEAKTILNDHGLEVFSLTPDNVDLALPVNPARPAEVDYYLRLLDFAAELSQPRGQPLVSCHGYVGRVRPISTMVEECKLFEQAVRRVAARAAELDLRLVMEVLNRYESHLLLTAAETLAFIAEVGEANVGVLLDAYHMNIEEAEPAAAIRQAGDKLWLYHVADSNRQGVGRGHTDFRAQMAALTDIGYNGPIILECTAPGPDPFAAIKGGDSLGWLEIYLSESLLWLREGEEGGRGAPLR